MRMLLSFVANLSGLSLMVQSHIATIFGDKNLYRILLNVLEKHIGMSGIRRDAKK